MSCIVSIQDNSQFFMFKERLRGMNFCTVILNPRLHVLIVVLNSGSHCLESKPFLGSRKHASSFQPFFETRFSTIAKNSFLNAA